MNDFARLKLAHCLAATSRIQKIVFIFLADFKASKNRYNGIPGVYFPGARMSSRGQKMQIFPEAVKDERFFTRYFMRGASGTIPKAVTIPNNGKLDKMVIQRTFCARTASFCARMLLLCEVTGSKSNAITPISSVGNF